MEPIVLEADVLSVQLVENGPYFNENQCIIGVLIPGEPRRRVMRFRPTPGTKVGDKIKVRLEPQESISYTFLEIV